MKRIATLALIATLAVTTWLTADDRKAAVLMQSAQAKEIVQGDLKGAISLYQNVVKEASSNRALAVKALLQMAECYRKLGDAESQKIYEGVVRDYADQKAAVATARVMLGGTDATVGMVSRLVWSGSQPTSISSDGRIASYSKDGNLFIHEIATGVDRNLTTWAKGASGVVQASVISRDGKHVVYRRAMPVERRSELWLANLEGDPNPRRLLGDPDVLWVGPYDWSPDNKWFAAALERKDGSSQIGLVSIPDGNLRVLKSVDGHRAHPRAKQCSTCDPHFSPDGKYLGYDLYENETGNERDVFVISIDGTHEVPVVVRPGNDEMLGWSPDGKWLLFTSDRTGSTDLWAVAFANGKTQDPPRWLKEDFGTKSWSVGLTSSGALYYLTNSGSGRFRLWSLENFLPKATAASR